MKSLKSFFCLVTLFVLNSYSSSYAKHAIAMHGEPKYGPNFKHFDTVREDAPKGGHLKLAVVGTFNSTNPYINQGIPPAGISLYSEKLIFEPLMKRSPNEPFTLYAWLAEDVEVAPDRSWVEFRLNEKAKWSDEKPVTVEDVIFTHEIMVQKGRYNLRSLYKRVKTVEKTGPRSIKFTFFPDEEHGSFDPELPLVIGMMNILPKHLIEKQDFNSTNWDPVIGSGPYQIKDMSLGKYIIYERRGNYWGKDLPIHKGQYNFDTIRYNYYLDNHIAFEAFKAHEYDLRIESDINLWKTSYRFPAVKKNKVKLLELSHKQPVGMKALTFNTRRSLFKDSRVRHALIQAFDFEWMNKNLLHNDYTRTKSYFDNTELASTDLPTGEELSLLKKYKDRLPKELFNHPYTLPKTTGTGQNRSQLRMASKLLADAGWVVKDNRLFNSATGEPFQFEILLYSKDDEKIVQSYIRNLKSLGIDASIRFLDTAQFENRRLQFDYDMIINYWAHSLSPGNEQMLYWGSTAAKTPASRNYAGVSDPVIDELATKIANSKTRKDLMIATRALDRVLLWGHYVVPLFYHNKYYAAYWENIVPPPFNPEASSLSIASWWVKEEQ